MVLFIKLSPGGLFIMHIRYAYSRGNNYYYQRKIPRDLLRHYAGSSHIKINLKTDDLKKVTKHVSMINTQYESIWASLRKDQDNANSFIKLRIPGLGGDTKKRKTFDSIQLSTLIHECKNKDDDVRWLLALQIDLGCRLAEVTGLALSDLRLNVGLPYVSIQPHPWRVLMTNSSKRNVPLVGVSLWAAYKIVESAKRRQLYAFPRYTNGGQCKANSASATLNKWIRSLGLDKTTHELRHTMRDRLRQTCAPKSIQDAVGGRGKRDLNDNYGSGYGLEQLKAWLDKVVLK